MFHSLTRPLLSALLAACLFFCGCSLFQPDQAPTPTPTASVSPASLPSPSPTPRIGNPVWIFYQDLYDAIDAPLNQLHEALAATPIQGADAAGDSACLDGELLLSALESRLTEGMMTLGLLLRSDSSSDTDPMPAIPLLWKGRSKGLVPSNIPAAPLRCAFSTRMGNNFPVPLLPTGCVMGPPSPMRKPPYTRS